LFTDVVTATIGEVATTARTATEAILDLVPMASCTVRVICEVVLMALAAAYSVGACTAGIEATLRSRLKSSGQSALYDGTVWIHVHENVRPAAAPVAPTTSLSLLADASRVIERSTATDWEAPPWMRAVIVPWATVTRTTAAEDSPEEMLVAVNATS
jgi:hypothetical protein